MTLAAQESRMMCSASSSSASKAAPASSTSPVNVREDGGRGGDVALRSSPSPRTRAPGATCRPCRAASLKRRWPVALRQSLQALVLAVAQAAFSQGALDEAATIPQDHLVPYVFNVACPERTTDGRKI